MLRGLILLILITGAVLFTLPFVFSSLYVDQRGVTIPGHVYAKSEDVTVHYSTWTRSCEMTVQYAPPDAPGTAFLAVHLSPERFDAFRKGQTVSLHYLPRKDIPDLPMAHVLSQIHALTTARLADERAFSAWALFFTPGTIVICCLCVGLIAVLFFWRRSGLPGFTWAVCAAVLATLAAVLISEFPKPVPSPAINMRRATGKVKRVERITRLFDGRRTRGMEAAQPIAVVGVEFVPARATEPVLAIDLIDAEPLSVMKEGATVAIDYEENSPRTAHIQDATRNFPGRNLRGIAFDGGLYLLVLVGGFAILQYCGQAWNRLLARR